MNLLVVSGSQRTQSQSAKVAKYISDVAGSFEQVSHLELCHYDLSYWDGDDISALSQDNPWMMIKHKLRKADAMVLITPEWGGMATPLLKSFLLMCHADDTAHKPALLVSVVSGISGAYPIAELRMNAFKNNKIVAIPEHLIVRNVNDVLNLQASSDIELISEQDLRIRGRIDHSLHTLYQYAQALSKLRILQQINPFHDQQNYAYGM